MAELGTGPDTQSGVVGGERSDGSLRARIPTVPRGERTSRHGCLVVADERGVGRPVGALRTRRIR